MSGWLWALTGAFMVTCFVLGVVTANRWRVREHRWNALLAVLFTIIGLSAVMDLVHVHTEVGGTLLCNQSQNDALVTIGRARREVDNAALVYDEKLARFFSVPVEQRQPDDPAAVEVRIALDALVAARQKAVTAYTENPLPYC